MKTYSQIKTPSNVGVRQFSVAVVFLLLSTASFLSGRDPVVGADSLTSKFTSYIGLIPRGEIYVHTDREEYIAGENLWFRLYLFDSQSGRLSSTAGIAYLEILNSDHYPVVQRRIKLDNGLGSGMAVLPDTLSSGTYTLRAYTNSMKNFMPGNCFSKGINVYNALNAWTFRTASPPYPETWVTGADESLSNGKVLAESSVSKSIIANQTIEFSDPGPVGIREKVVLEFQLTAGGDSSGHACDFSISVSPAGSDPAQDFVEYLLYCSASGMADRSTLLSRDYTALKYEAEKDHHFIRGQLLDRSGQGLAAGRYMFLAVPGENAAFQYSLTDNEGWFEFSLPIDERISDIIIQPENPRPDDVIRMEPAFYGRLQESERLPAFLAAKSGSHIVKWGVNYQLRRIFGTDSVLPPRISVLKAREVKRFYGKPEIELFMKDYIELPVMEEVFYELLEGIQLRSRKTGYEITMTDPVYNKPYEKAPVMFVDGVVVNDPSVLASLDPDKVEKIDVIRSRYVVGDYLFFGVVNVITKKGDFSSVVLPDYAVRQPYTIFDPEPEFWSPSYPDQESRHSRIPDLRNTLYWNPSLKPGSDGRFRVEFWSSDYVTDYEINIQGVDSQGEPVSFRTMLRAKE
ncbi:MAG: hypothetical protein JXR67_04795 [Bacteroidales bacterium]|nr:hypothetical protein [Bacteroidales bacterium]